MKIAVITITCNRLELTKKYLSELKDKNNTQFEHIIVDNGSTDGTIEWLFENNYTVIRLNKNIGVIRALLIGVKYVRENINPDFIVKFDNDCEIQSFGTLDKIINWYNSGCHSFVSAPLDVDILSEKMPKQFRETNERGLNISFTQHIGGIFVVAPSEAFYQLEKAPIDLVSEDLKRGKFWWSIGYPVVYFKDLKINHKGLFKSVENYKLLNEIIERPK